MHLHARPPTNASLSLLRPPQAGAQPAGPPPGPAGPNLTDPSPNHGRTWTHEPGEADASRGAKHALHGVFPLANVDWAVKMRIRPPELETRICDANHRDEEFPSVLNPSSLLVQIDGGRLNPVVDLIGGSTAAYSLKCRFPRETGRSQAPRRQQALTPPPPCAACRRRRSPDLFRLVFRGEFIGDKILQPSSAG
ncbi:hypothetical protein F511_22224 [Dorcoceras hygrometricum]|uniref:Uncharacterized protein n=1 Tax=Dorcoceras hygrometricum TaxID=472368 RepID=A0A2Z7D7L0_9LAMI|nr:hypothetical protein F511_22224 [Dorcoceras hygrometricum]